MSKAAKIYITVITLVTIAAILFGLGIHVFRNDGFLSFKNEEHMQEEVKLDGTVTTLAIDVDAAEIIISKGSACKVSYDMPKSLKPEIELKGGKLSVSGKAKRNRISNLGINEKSEIRIELPMDTDLEKVFIRTDFGNVNMEGIDADTYDIETDAGNVELKDFSAKEMKISCDAGNIEMKKGKVDELIASVDAGNVEIDDSTIDLVDIETDAGNIEITNATVNGGKCTTDLGNIELSGKIGDVKTKTSLGNVEVNGN